MEILGIRNRTENWKTTRYFSPLFGESSVCLAKRLGEHPGTRPSDVRLELYWRGMRDHLHQAREKRKDNYHDFAERYKHLFPDLRKRIVEFRQSQGLTFRDLRPGNYDVSTEDWKINLGNNLVNTEIDIVLESPNYLFIGEAKGEMSFGADGSLVLVHQLIRQYVMARILTDRLECRKEVVPFVVGGEAKHLKNSRQVDFMIRQGWMKEENVLEWDQVKDLARNS